MQMYNQTIKAKIKRKIKRFSVLCICGIVILSTIAVDGLTVEAEENSTTYDEGIILDEMAISWQKTCDSIQILCAEAIGKSIVGEVTDAEVEDDLLSCAGSLVVTIGTDEYQSALQGTDELERYNEALSTLKDPEADSIAMDAATEVIKQSISQGSVDSFGDTVLDIVKANATLEIGAAYCGFAKNCFSKALKTSDIEKKREYMAQGADYATIGCGVSIEDADAMIKNPEMTDEDLYAMLIDKAFDVIGEFYPVIGVAYDVITITANISISLMAVDNTLQTLRKYIDGSLNPIDDINAFWSTIVNQFDVYEIEFSEYRIILKKYVGYLMTNANYNIVDPPKDMYGFPVIKLAGDFLKDADVTEVTIPEWIIEVGTPVINNCDNLQTVNYYAKKVETTGYSYVIDGCDSNFIINWGGKG